MPDIFDQVSAGAAPPRSPDVFDQAAATPTVTPRLPRYGSIDEFATAPDERPTLANAPVNETGSPVRALPSGADIKNSFEAGENPGAPTTPTEAFVDAYSREHLLAPGMMRTGLRALNFIPRTGAAIEQWLTDLRNTPRPPGVRTGIDPHTGQTFTYNVPATGVSENERKMAMAQEPATLANAVDTQLPPNRFDATIGGTVTTAIGELPSIAAMGEAAPAVLGLKGAADTTRQLEDAGVPPRTAQVAGGGVGAATGILFGASPINRMLTGAAGEDVIDQAAKPFIQRAAVNAAKQGLVGAGTEAAGQAAQAPPWAIRFSPQRTSRSRDKRPCCRPAWRRPCRSPPSWACRISSRPATPSTPPRPFARWGSRPTKVSSSACTPGRTASPTVRIRLRQRPRPG